MTANYQKLNIDDFIMGEAPFNAKCHINSVQKVKEGKAVKVFSCIAVDKTDNSQCIHFINQLSDGKYQDNTWGWRYVQHDYYLIKEISADEQEHIWDCLTDIRHMLAVLNSNKVERFLCKLDIDSYI